MYTLLCLGLIIELLLPTTASHEFFKRNHKIGKTNLRVEMVSPGQQQNVAYKMGTLCDNTSSALVSTKKLPPLKGQRKTTPRTCPPHILPPVNTEQKISPFVSGNQMNPHPVSTSQGPLPSVNKGRKTSPPACTNQETLPPAHTKWKNILHFPTPTSSHTTYDQKTSSTVQQGNVAQSTGSLWPDPSNDGQTILHMTPLKGDHGSSDHVRVKQPVIAYPPILVRQKSPTTIRPYLVSSSNMLPFTDHKRAPPRFQNPPKGKKMGEKTGNNDEQGSNQRPPVPSIKVEGHPKNWDESGKMAFNKPNLGGEIGGQFPWLQH